MSNLPSDIIIRYGIEWEKLGLLLGLKEYDIGKISDNYTHHPRRIKNCFIAMLQQWIVMAPTATWGKVDDAMKQLTQQSDQTSMCTKI